MFVTGYTYDAAVHCPDCTIRDYERGYLKNDSPDDDWLDKNGLPEALVKTTGTYGERLQFVGVVFYNSETDYEQACDNCFEPIETTVLNECYA